MGRRRKSTPQENHRREKNADRPNPFHPIPVTHRATPLLSAEPGRAYAGRRPSAMSADIHECASGQRCRIR